MSHPYALVSLVPASPWSIALLAMLALSTSACLVESPPSCDAGGSCTGEAALPAAAHTCEDARYGNGTCETEPLCGMPDPDCFHLFASFDEVQAEFLPNQTVPLTDARYQRVNRVLAEVWQTMRTRGAVPLGELAAATPYIILVERARPSGYALVLAPVREDEYTGRLALVMSLTTGIEALASSDSALAGVIAHELSHAVRMHHVSEVESRYRVPYVARPGVFGFAAVPDSLARTFLERRTALEKFYGEYDQVDLGGVILPFQIGQIAPKFATSIAETPECKLVWDAWALYVRTAVDENPYVAGLRATLGLPPDLATQFATLRGCLGTTNFLARSWRPQLPADDVAAVAHLDGFAQAETLMLRGRAKLRALSAEFEDATGVPWNRLHQYTTEEVADDDAFVIVSAMGLSIAAYADLLLMLRDGNVEVREQCKALVSAGAPVYYGRPDDDLHHTDCRRYEHFMELSAAGILPRAPLR